MSLLHIQHTPWIDEMLIDAVEQRPGLWNQKLSIQKRNLSARAEL